MNWSVVLSERQRVVGDEVPEADPVMGRTGSSGGQGGFWPPVEEWLFLVYSKCIHTCTHKNKMKQNTLAAA